MNRAAGILLALFVVPMCGAAAGQSQVQEIVARSVRNTDADWAAAPRYDFTERDVITKGGKRNVNTYQVLMIEGSPYEKLTATNDEPLSKAKATTEERKLQQETARRRRESPAARRKRIAEYARERRQDHELMDEMVQAFTFKLEGEQTIDGRRCFVLDAAPRPGYEPKSRETKALKGMRGKMWIDVQQYQWVKVHAEVFEPVTFGLFIAHVEPGTEFTLEQKPVQGNVWLPSHFQTRVKAQILIFSRRSVDEETYRGYGPSATEREP